MKVLFINSVYGVGSTGKIVRDLSQELLNRGHDVKVCYGRKSPDPDVFTKQICSNIEFSLDVCLSRLTGLHGCFSNIATNRLIQEINEFSPDIVHLHNIHGYFINIFRLIKYIKKKKIKVVWTLHDELMFTGKCSYAYDCDKWLTGCKQCNQVHEYPKSILFDFSKLLYDWKQSCFKEIYNFCLITPSQWLANRVGKSCLRDARCRVINNGIDVDNIFYIHETDQLRVHLGLSDEKIIVTVTDNVYSERKGIDVFIKLADCYKNKNIKFIVVGGKRDDLTRENVIYIPMISNQNELAEYYSLADVFVITSRCDNFPTVCLEALACGTPVVGFQVGGIPETAPFEAIGRFVEKNNIDAMIDAIDMYLDHPRGDYENRCRTYAEKYYSKQHMNEEYMEVFQKLFYSGDKCDAK